MPGLVCLCPYSPSNRRAETERKCVRTFSAQLALMDQYRRGLLPLVVPVTLLKHHLRRHPVPDWVHQQVYLNPYPSELMLRNHV